jgi:hypothetical protein
MQNEETIFEAAIQKPNPAERAAYLEGACGGDPERRRRIEALVRAHQQSGGLLDSSRSDAGSITADVEAPLDHPPLAEGPGAHIGPYKLLQQIVEGGMGVVYMAEQQEPVRRKVALKIIKPGMDSRQVITRGDGRPVVTDGRRLLGGSTGRSIRVRTRHRRRTSFAR